ncbi:MAG: ATP-binding cassette domain-containing protein, partial [Caldilineaceae bacterium]|nr:ATP-binding cassette domain-containing protein [Caldilineaceae bacterium]
MSEPVIYTHHLTRIVGAQRAVDRVTMTMDANTILGIVGPEGAGKTTLLHLLAGRMLPTCGVAKVLGYDVWTQDEAVRSHTFFVGAPPAHQNTLLLRADEMLSAIKAKLPSAPLILLDAPATHWVGFGDGDFRLRLESCVREAGAALLLTGVGVEELGPICDNVGVLWRGRLLTVIPAAEIHTRHA